MSSCKSAVLYSKLTKTKSYSLPNHNLFINNIFIDIYNMQLPMNAW